jgi:hypothetical protein
MRRSSGVLVVTLVMASCGGSSETKSGGPLDPGFAKTWGGGMTMACTGLDPMVSTGSMPITVSGSSLMVGVGCLDLSVISLAYTGSGATASWVGSASCPPTAYGTCPTWVYTRTSGTITLNANGTLTASGVGTLVGCGVSVDCTTSFNGT